MEIEECVLSCEIWNFYFFFVDDRFGRVNGVVNAEAVVRGVGRFQVGV